MKYLKTTFLFAFIAILTSCSNKEVNYNNALVRIQKELEPKVTDFTNHINSFAEGDDVSKINLEADTLIKFTESKIAEVNKLETPAGGDKLKNSFLAQFNFILDYCKNTKISNEANATEEQKAAASQWMIDAQVTGAKLTEELKAAQVAFAKDKGFKLDTK